MSRVVELCSKNSFMASPKRVLELNLADISSIFEKCFKIKLHSKFFLALERSDGVSISLMKTCNALIKGVSEKSNTITI